MKLFPRLLIPLLLFLTLPGIGQNLIPNPSFEEYSRCPKKLNLYEVGRRYRGKPRDIKKWKQPTLGSFDYFNSCSSKQDLSTPKNCSSFQIPRTGKGYVGIILIEAGKYAEYIQVKLKKPLRAGELYFFRLYYTSADYYQFQSENVFGAYISKERVHSKSNVFLPCKPQITNESVKDRTEPESWIPVCGVYEAKGGERYVTIGRFDNRPPSDSVPKNYTGFVYIDDVSLVKVNTEADCRCETDSSKIPLPFSSEISGNDTLCEQFYKKAGKGNLYLLKSVSFTEDPLKLTRGSLGELDALVYLMKKYPEISISIYSHSSVLKDEKASYTLTTHKSKLVAEYLEKSGVEKSRVQTQGYGATLPMGDDLTPAGKLINNRTEFRIIKK